MTLGNSLSAARKKSGMSQEEVAERLGVSRQTISKWETDETLPDIRQTKTLAGLYRLSLDDLRELTALDGVYAEQSYALMPIDGQTPAQVAGYIREVGAEHTIMTTDLGQRGRQSSGEGMALFRELMEGEGISLAELDVMTIQNPARLLGV